MGMDLVAVILAETGPSLGKCKKTREILDKNLAPHINAYFKSASTSYSMMSRAVKLATQLMLSLQSSYGLLGTIMGYSTSPQVWIRYIVLEAISGLLSVPAQIQQLHLISNNETHGRVLKDVINSIINIVKRVPEKSSEDKQALKLSITRNKKVLDVMEAVPTEPPHITHAQYIYLIGETLNEFIVALQELYIREGIPAGKLATVPFTSIQTERVIDLVTYSWRPLYDMLMFVLSNTDEQIVAKQVLRNIQILVNILGSSKLNTALNTVLKDLCQISLPTKLSNCSS
jgi:hypothetical protein